ncbi:hypothetical protein PT2222_40161 [Paraburkholderia tropica]
MRRSGRSDEVHGVILVLHGPPNISGSHVGHSIRPACFHAHGIVKGYALDVTERVDSVVSDEFRGDLRGVVGYLSEFWCLSAVSVGRFRPARRR